MAKEALVVARGREYASGGTLYTRAKMKQGKRETARPSMNVTYRVFYQL